MPEHLEPIPEHLPSLPAATLADGRYVLVRPIAEGGTAAVYLGWDTWSHEWRAVKTLLPDFAIRAALRHRFEVEARTMAMLEHEHIVRVHDAGIEATTDSLTGEPRETAFMVMDYAEGGSVVDWIEQFGPMPPRLAVDVTLALCAGIRAAHDQGIIHRDIKPQNLLIDGEGRCKVTDFGIAQVVEETRLTMTGTVMGTIGYMAPEQHESAKHTDERADIYSIAATLYTLAMGRAATHLFMADARDFEGLAECLSEVIQKGAQYRREERYPDVGTMMSALQVAREQLPAPPPSTPHLAAGGPLQLDAIEPPSVATATPAPGRIESEGGSQEGLHRLPEGSLEPAPMPPPFDPRRLSEDAPVQVIPTSRLTDSGKFREVRPYGHGLEEARKRQDMVVVAAVVAMVTAVLLGSTFWMHQQGVAMVDRAEIHAEESRTLLYDAMMNEWGMVDDLDALGLDHQEVRDLLEEIDHADDVAHRSAAAGRLLNLIEQLSRQARQDAGPNVHILRSLEARVARIDRAAQRQREAERTASQVRATVPGRVATFFGG